MLKIKKTVYIEIRKSLAEVLTINENSELLYEAAMKKNSTLNSYLSYIMEYVGINKHISFHYARHTFAILSLFLKIPMEIVSDLLGALQY